MKRAVWSWAMYDWANSAFATVVMAGFFPVFFKQYWAAGASASQSTLQLGVANAVASIIIVVAAPVLGAMADYAAARKRFLLLFATLGVVMTGALYFVAAGAWFAAAACYVMATLGFMGGNVFYDALLVSVAEKPRMERVSALGYALGYLGGGLLFAFLVFMTLRPQTFGLADAAAAVRLSFICVAAWWALFAVPLFLFVHEERRAGRPGFASVMRGGFAQLVQTLRHVRQLRTVMVFLAAYWCYIDGVDTIVRMAVDYGLAIGFDAGDLMTALLITQFVGFPAALAFGRVAEVFGTKRAIYIALAVYAGVTLWAARIDTAAEFYGLAVVIGLVQGGIQSLSRAYYAHLIPPDKAAEFFGFYNMLGKFAAVIGPLLMGWVSVVTGNPRASVLALLALFIAGAVLLSRVDDGGAGRAGAGLRL